MLLGELAQHPIASRASSRIQQLGLKSSFEIFSDCEMVLTGGFSHLVIRRRKLRSVIHISRELAPALTFAHYHFGDHLPQDLISKLQNKPQTLDTLFELSCLGILQLCHAVSYEPTLASGKVPDLMISSPEVGDVYVECKSGRMIGTEHQRIFGKFTSLCLDAMEDSNVQRLAWEQGLRTEIRLSATPSPCELGYLREFVASATVEHLLRGRSIGNSINVVAVPKHQSYLAGPSTKIARIKVGTASTRIAHENAHIVAYSWPGIDQKRRRSQRSLLARARRKLASIPGRSFGMICLQTFCIKPFTQDVHQAVIRPEFERTPIVWLNPQHESNVTSRDDALQIRDAIFAPLQKEL